jgi:tetratricopeptide (TPR) repeat protein
MEGESNSSDAGSGESQAKTIDDYRKLVGAWPYARQFVLDTMDENVIERHGELILYRALNIGRAVAFVGAGVSMSYGRISWRELVRVLYKDAENPTGPGSTPEEKPKDSPDARIQILRETLKKLDPGLQQERTSKKSKEKFETDRGWGEIPASRLPALFQIADEMGIARARAQKKGPNSTRDKARRLVFDDAGHAHVLLQSAEPDILDSLKLKREDLSLDFPSYAGVFTRQFLGELVTALQDPQGSQPVEFLELLELFRQHNEGDDNPSLNPTHRFVTAAALSAFPKKDRREMILNEKGSPLLHGERVRNKIVSPERDPLLILVEQLGISRFLTTNYDLDIERLMLDRGFRLHGSENVNAMGARARDFVLTPEKAAFLVDFAVQDTRFAIDVAHLHGRATEGDEIVATEADYQALYLRDDGRRDLLDGAIDLAFKGNALLFVGNGLGEDDVLRPLRQFMSEGRGGREAEAVALLPDRDVKTRVEEKVLLLHRYGVYAIHFGKAHIRGTEERHEKWILATIVGTLRLISKLLASPASTIKPATKAKQRLWDLIEADTSGKSAIKEGLIEEVGRNERGSKVPKIDIDAINFIEGHRPEIVRLELETLNYLFDFWVRRECGNDSSENEAVAAKILADNLEDAITAGFLAAALHRLDRGWASWRKDWFGEIVARDPAPQPIEIKKDKSPDQYSAFFVKGRSLSMDRRRAIELLDYDEIPNPKMSNIADRHFQAKFSQTLARVCASLRQHAEKGEPARRLMHRPGRRVFLFAGPRGVGKGHFYSAVTEFDGVLKFLDASWPLKKEKPYLGIIAFNMSFSVELGSGFDRLTRFMKAKLQENYDSIANRAGVGEAAQFNKLFQELASSRPHGSGDRVGALDLIFRVMSGREKGIGIPSGRFAIFINASHLLFGPGGFAKSADITRLMRIILNPNYSNAPVDVVLVCDEQGIPLEFRNRAISPALKEEMPRTMSEEPPFPWTVEVMDAVVESTRAEIEDKVVARRLGLRTSMTETTDGIQSAVRETKEQRENRENTTALFMRLHPSMLGVVASAAFPHVLAALAVTARFGKGGHELKNVHLKPGTQELMLGILTKAAESGARGVVERMDFAQQLWGLDLCEGALAPNGRDHHELDRRLGDYFKAFGGNRFGFTIAFAVAEEDWEETGDISKTIRTLDEVREEASGIEEPSRQDAIIRAVLSIHKSRGIRENLNEKLLNVPGRSGRAWKDALANKHCIEFLCEELLSILAMIGFPVDAECICVLPLIAFRGNNRGGGLSKEQRWMRVCLALDVLVRRCLVFRFVPSGAEKDEFGRPNRFGVHRHVQRHAFRYLQQPLVEQAEIESFMPTLYASQPNDLPYPTASAQQRIREVVSALSRYPSQVVDQASLPGDLQSRMVRAAYGVIRTVYGVGVVARFHEYVEDGPPEGYFEEHRRHVRWLLKRAQALGPQVSADPLQSATDTDVKRSAPFYTGEIAWLYNESGVLSLVQGNLDDAAALFAQAIRVLNEIERRGAPAALTSAVRLNRALVDIERGHLRKADATLRDITSFRDEHRAVRWIAYGYRGLIEHLRGNRDKASSKYEQATKVLNGLKRYRAASIFMRHHADLKRSLGKASLEEARGLVDEAVNLAAAGSHSDVLYQARLTRLRIRADQEGPGCYADLRRELRTIEHYAKVMGMPRLEIEVLYFEAVLRSRLGDLGMAMKRNSRSLALANTCDLVLRKISSMVLAAELSKDLDNREGARALAEAAKSMAIVAECSMAQDRAQTLLASL